MSTQTTLDKICVAIVVCSLLLTALFINGESLGITKIVDEDAEQNSDTEYFTSKDQDGDWDSSDATVITLKGDGAVISGNGAYANDGNVVITNAGYYVVSGTLTDGYLSVDAYDSSKIFIRFDGVEINCSDNACIRVEKADKVFLTLAEGSQNTLTSGSTYSDQALNDGTDGAVFAHDDLTINGSGSLTVNAAYRHGIAANDDLVITGGTINVTAAADAIHANDSLRIKEAVITVEAGDDGLVTSNKEENGYLYIESGIINVTAAGDGINATGDITLAGGDVTISAGDDGIHSDTSVYIQNGTLLIDKCYEGIEALIIDVSGGDTTIYPTDDGFNANGNSDSQIGAGGMGRGRGPGMGAWENLQGSQDTGTEASTGDPTEDIQSAPDMGSEASTGNMANMPATPDMDSTTPEENMPAPPDMGSEASTGNMANMPATPDMGSTTPEKNMPAPTDMGSTTPEENMPAPTDMGSTTAAGNIPATPDMGSNMNSEMNTGEDGTQQSTKANDEETYINISGGTVTIINETGNDADGLDSNGDIFISGGNIYVSLQGSGTNNAVDFGGESGGVAEISGGTIIACGASSMAEAFDSTSTQASILYNTSTVAEAGTTLAVKNAEGDVLLSWEVPCSFSSALVSCPQLETGSTYTVAIGDDTEEITLEEVSASYGDAQSSMFGGNMNRSGMKHRNGRFDNNTSQDGSTQAQPGQVSTDTGQGGSARAQAGQVSADTSQGDSAQAQPGQVPADTSQGGSARAQAGQDSTGMAQGGMADAEGTPSEEGQNQQSQEEEDQTAEEKSTAKPIDLKTRGILGGCTALLLAGIAISRLYKRP